MGGELKPGDRSFGVGMLLVVLIMVMGIVSECRGWA